MQLTKWVYALFFASIFAAAGQLLFRKGALNALHWTEFINPAILLGLLSYSIGTLLWIFSLSKLPLKTVYPFTIFTFALVYIGAAFIFKENFSLRGFLGVLMIFGGLVLILSDA